MAAVTFTGLTSGNSTTDGTSFNTASITVPSGQVAFLCVGYSRNGQPDPPTPTGAVSTWHLIESEIFKASGNRTALAMFWGVGTGSAAAVSIGFSYTAMGCTWAVITSPEADPADPIGDVQKTSASPGNGATYSVALGTPVDGDSRPLANFAANVNGSQDIEGTWTAYGGQGHNGPSEWHGAAWSGSWDASVTVTNNGGQATVSGLIAVEVLAAAGSQDEDVTAATSGSGTLTAAVVQAADVAAATSGSGTTSASVVQSADVTAATSGSGTATASVVQAATVVAATSGSGTAAAAVVPGVVAAPFGSGTASATIIQNATVTAAASGSGTLAASVDGSSEDHDVTADTTGSGTLAATIAVGLTAASSGTGTVAATLAAGHTVTAASSGAGTIAGTVEAGHQITAATSGTGTLAAAIATEATVTADTSGEGTLTATALDPSGLRDITATAGPPDRRWRGGAPDARRTATTAPARLRKATAPQPRHTAGAPATRRKAGVP